MVPFRFREALCFPAAGGVIWDRLLEDVVLVCFDIWVVIVFDVGCAGCKVQVKSGGCHLNLRHNEKQRDTQSEDG